MTPWAVPRLYRRAILVYFLAIVAPVAAFVWLGIQTVTGQRAIILAQAQQAVAQELAATTDAAAKAAFDLPEHPIVGQRFEMREQTVVWPRLHAPIPDNPPAEFLEAYRQQAAGKHDAALASFRALLEDRPAQARARDAARTSLAIYGVARSLDALGREEEARDVWRRLAREFSDERDLSHRPYGIVAAMAAGDVDGLYAQITAGRWDLSGDYAEYVLDQLRPGHRSTFLDRFRLGEVLNQRFQPGAGLDNFEMGSTTVDNYRLFYRSEGDRVHGFSVNEQWVLGTLRQIEDKFDVRDTARKDLGVYAGSVVLVLLVLSGGVVVLLRDVSREAKINAARAELVSSVSHELKTPITLIRLYSETLLQQTGFTNEDRAGFYRIIARESTRLGRLIDQVLTFARVERRAQVYHFEAGDLAPVVAGVVDDYREYLEHAGFVLRQSVPATTPIVRFDSAAIAQALLNLLDNAVKYSGSSRDIGVRVFVDAGQVAIEVEDHGIGIAPADQEKVFERFYRVSNSAGKGGYGLGLFLVRHVMEAHGGRAEVESCPGRGSRFRLVLPVAAA